MEYIEQYNIIMYNIEYGKPGIVLKMVKVFNTVFILFNLTIEIVKFLTLSVFEPLSPEIC